MPEARRERACQGEKDNSVDEEVDHVQPEL
ncbi:hypothetical protein JOF48_001971 [Arthrobacter stackebrandtii]|uniref:Uncharacterized protein n=1 Tax=Arthrobacter stackebrandtii TaxID=272161 RepID=A0ABS4YXJ7_9MICC|nr:hypothetical protein [Arthrobacter stackebrandtii]